MLHNTQNHFKLSIFYYIFAKTHMILHIVLKAFGIKQKHILR